MRSKKLERQERERERMSEYIKRKKERKRERIRGRREREGGRLCVFYNVLQGGKKVVLTIIMYMYSWSLNIKLTTCTVHVSQMIVKAFVWADDT